MKRRCSIQGPDNARTVGEGQPLAIIAGPCVIESEALCMRVAEALAGSTAGLGLPYIFKASFDKANRTSVGSPRGPGLEEGLAILEKVRERFRIPVTTDIHLPDQADLVARTVDVLQIPAFLCRQTDLLLAAGEAASRHACAVNIKKGQFLSPGEMDGPVMKVASAGCENIIVTDRGTFFGYNRLVSDFIGVGDLLEAGNGAHVPAVCFDATHSAQLPGAGTTSGGRRERVPLLAQAAAGAGVDVLFMECHPDPERAESDASTMLPLEAVPALLDRVKRIAEIVR